MNFTDPTYLRSIVDGLSTGSINKDNAKALPVGLVGIYEEALPPANNVNERKKFLEFFGVWALLKKEVSVTFVLPLLEDWTEQEVLDYIGKYSKWFNSPDSGKYVLYHERLRAFIQQKIAHAQFTKFNEHIISTGQSALALNQGDEWERYALEYLSTHLLIKAIETGNSDGLKTLAYNTSHWNRQIEISKGFEWSKSLLNDMMLWSSKYDDEEVIECAGKYLEIHQAEQNDFNSIFTLITTHDVEIGLARLETFGGNHTLGLKRKVVVIILILKRLITQNYSDNKTTIEQLLHFFDNQIPNDFFLTDFFTVDFLDKIINELQILGVESRSLKSRTQTIPSKVSIDIEKFEDKLSRLISKWREKQVETEIFELLLSPQLTTKDKYEKINSYITLLRSNNSISLREFNHCVSILAEYFLINGEVFIIDLVRQFRVGLTTKSIQYNDFLILWLTAASEHKAYKLCNSILELIFDDQIKTKAICFLLLEHHENLTIEEQNDLFSKVVSNENNFNRLIKNACNANNDNISNKLFIIAIENKFEIDPLNRLEVYLKLLEYSFSREVSHFKPICNEIKNLISYVSNNIQIREFMLYKYIVKFVGLLIKHKRIDLACDILIELYILIDDFEDWLSLVYQCYQELETADVSKTFFYDQVGSRIMNQLDLMINSDLPKRKKARLITENHHFLVSLYAHFNSSRTYERLLEDFEISITESNQLIAEIQAANSFNQRLNYLIKSIPLSIKSDFNSTILFYFEYQTYKQYKLI
jgi:hypothetical protein